MARIRKTSVEQDKMTDQNIRRVIDLLEPKNTDTKPITKKDACQILGMSYNTTRLQQVIENYKAKVLRDQQLREAKRGKPVSQDEINFAISEYLNGESIEKISRELYRSSAMIKGILEKNAVPIRNIKYNYFTPALIPEEATRERFQLDEIVYSSRYDSKAKICHELWSEKHNCWIYRIWLLAEKWQQFAYQESFELASLEHLKKQGIRLWMKSSGS